MRPTVNIRLDRRERDAIGKAFDIEFPPHTDDPAEAINNCLRRANRRFDIAINNLRYPYPQFPMAA